MRTILVVDDQATERRLLYHTLKKDYEVVEASDGQEAFSRLNGGKVDLTLLDMHLPPDTRTTEEGIRLHRGIRERYPLLPVVIITGDRDRELALEMVRSGVTDFLLKPVDPVVLKIVIARALERSRLEQEVHRLREEMRERNSFGNLIGSSPAMRQVFAKLEKLAGSRTTVFLLGESGTGKSAVARALHYAGERAEKPFVVVDPAAIPESLMESELFGHVKGAFTGATEEKIGRLHGAHGGTLFLDEIGNLNASIQAKLLLFLDQHTLTPVGSRKEIPVNVRLITATNGDLDAMVREGKFRADLLYRIQVATVMLPPLRERRKDIEPLAGHLLASLCKEMGRPRARLTPEASELLEQFPWPGNVRQLKHVLESSLVQADGDVLDVSDLILPASPVEAPRMVTSSTELLGTEESKGETTKPTFKERLAALERRLLSEALEKTAGNKTAAGRLLGLDENQIRYLCRKHRLT